MKGVLLLYFQAMPVVVLSWSRKLVAFDMRLTFCKMFIICYVKSQLQQLLSDIEAPIYQICLFLPTVFVLNFILNVK